VERRVRTRLEDDISFGVEDESAHVGDCGSAAGQEHAEDQGMSVSVPSTKSWKICPRSISRRVRSALAKLLGEDLILIHGNKPPTRLRDQLLLPGRDRVGACPKFFLSGVQSNRQHLPRVGVAKPVAGAAAAQSRGPWHSLGSEQLLGFIELAGQPVHPWEVERCPTGIRHLHCSGIVQEQPLSVISGITTSGSNDP
jgi:hypothetical protein